MKKTLTLISFALMASTGTNGGTTGTTGGGM